MKALLAAGGAFAATLLGFCLVVRAGSWVCGATDLPGDAQGFTVFMGAGLGVLVAVWAGVSVELGASR